jgi:hypothetical protein
MTISFLLYFSNAEATTWPADYKFPTATETTLKAKHIVVGEVTHISFVFGLPEFNLPFSFVTIRVDWDIKQAIERAEQQNELPADRPDTDKSKTHGTEPTVTFVQVGGPNADGDTLRVVGSPVLKRKDLVFLRLVPTIRPIEHDGQQTDVCLDVTSSLYFLKEESKPLEERLIPWGWGRLDVTVSQMARITRATLKQPERMQALEYRMRELRRAQMPKPAQLNLVMREVAGIETELNLSPLQAPQKGN